MSRFRKLSQTIRQCQYHIMWTPKYRYRVLTDEIAKEGVIILGPGDTV